MLGKRKQKTRLYNTSSPSKVTVLAKGIKGFYTCPIYSKVRWCPGTELNCRHADFQSAALPTELPGQRTHIIKKSEFVPSNSEFITDQKDLR